LADLCHINVTEHSQRFYSHYPGNDVSRLVTIILNHFKLAMQFWWRSEWALAPWRLWAAGLVAIMWPCVWREPLELRELLDSLQEKLGSKGPGLLQSSLLRAEGGGLRGARGRLTVEELTTRPLLVFMRATSSVVLVLSNSTIRVSIWQRTDGSLLPPTRHYKGLLIGRPPLIYPCWQSPLLITVASSASE
jgi:hypothetical protein